MTSQINSFEQEVDGIDMSACENGVDSCKHEKLKGKDSVIEFISINRGGKKVCGNRRKYVEQRAMSFITWAEENLPGFDGDKYLAHVEWAMYDRDLGLPHPSRNDDIQVDTQSTFDFESNSEEEFQAWASGNKKMEDRVSKALSKYWSIDGRHERTLSYWSNQEEYYTKGMISAIEELKLSDTIQDFLDKDNMSKDLALKAKKRLDQLLKDKKLSWGTFVPLANQLHAILGWKQINSSKGFTAADTRDFYSRGVQWAQAMQKISHSLYIELQGLERDQEDEDSLSGAQIYSMMTYSPRIKRA